MARSFATPLRPSAARSPVPRGRSRHEILSSLSGRADALLARLAQEDDFFRRGSLARSPYLELAAAPPAPRRAPWRRLARRRLADQRRVDLRRHYAAYLIQVLWRMWRDERAAEPDLRAFFPFDLADVRRAEVRSLRALGYRLARRALEAALGIRAAQPSSGYEEDA
jgi:hypothetical protein